MVARVMVTPGMRDSESTMDGRGTCRGLRQTRSAQADVIARLALGRVGQRRADARDDHGLQAVAGGRGLLRVGLGSRPASAVMAGAARRHQSEARRGSRRSWWVMAVLLVARAAWLVLESRGGSPVAGCPCTRHTAPPEFPASRSVNSTAVRVWRHPPPACSASTGRTSGRGQRHHQHRAPNRIRQGGGHETWDVRQLATGYGASTAIENSGFPVAQMRAQTGQNGRCSAIHRGESCQSLHQAPIKT